MKKNMNSDKMYVIKGSSDKDIFPVGFEYMLGDTIYTVRQDITKDTASPMRRVVSSDGSVEEMTIETIKKDLQEHDAKIISTVLEKKEK
jgi:hypothetical protein